MAYDKITKQRIEQEFDRLGVDFEAKKMMGGICFKVDDKMCVCVHEEKIMARIGKDAYDEALKIEGCEQMTFTGREMKGFVFIYPHAYESDEALSFWINKCLMYNPLAKSSKKRKSI